jgi:hypothetical protein
MEICNIYEDEKCPNCGYYWDRDLEQSRKRVEQELSRFDKITSVKVHLHSRPDKPHYKKTYSEAQEACLKELCETNNPYKMGDFLNRLAMILALQTNSSEGSVSGSSRHFESVDFKFKMTEQGKKDLLTKKEDDEE